MASKVSPRKGMWRASTAWQCARAAGYLRSAGRCVRAAMLGDRSIPMVAPLLLARTSRRNISPLPVATSRTRMPARNPEASAHLQDQLAVDGHSPYDADPPDGKPRELPGRSGGRGNETIK